MKQVDVQNLSGRKDSDAAIHKARLCSSKGRLALLGSIAKTLFVKREPLATQAF
jgi:hypothetical protein